MGRWQHIRTQRHFEGFRVQVGKRKKEVVFSYRIIQKEKPQKIIYGRYTELLRKYRSTDGRSQKDKRSLKNKGVDNNKPTPYHKERRLYNGIYKKDNRRIPTIM